MKLDLERQRPGRSLWPVSETVRLNDVPAGPAAAALSGQLAVDNLESRLVITGTLQASSTVVCDRCLEPFTMHYDVAVEWLIIRDAVPEAESDSWVIHQRSGEVELDEPLHEAVVIALPQKWLCGEDCRGMCPGCGVNRNREECQCGDETLDPRWDDLPSV